MTSTTPITTSTTIPLVNVLITDINDNNYERFKQIVSQINEFPKNEYFTNLTIIQLMLALNRLEMFRLYAEKFHDQFNEVLNSFIEYIKKLHSKEIWSRMDEIVKIIMMFHLRNTNNNTNESSAIVQCFINKCLFGNGEEYVCDIIKKLMIAGFNHGKLIKIINFMKLQEFGELEGYKLNKLTKKLFVIKEVSDSELNKVHINSTFNIGTIKFDTLTTDYITENRLELLTKDSIEKFLNCTFGTIDVGKILVDDKYEQNKKIVNYYIQQLINN